MAIRATDTVLKRKVHRLVKRWINRLNIPGDWSIAADWGGPEMGSCHIDLRYKTMQLTFNLDRIRSELDELSLEELVVHELCHIFTWRVWMLCDKLIDLNYGDKDHELWTFLLSNFHEEATTSLGMAFTQLAHEND